MYLKTLELHGFKSFPDKTVLRFNPGATVIVGPNGSGKSNITDAMRWVLGEISTKNIRGSKMEDVIFVGADGHRPMSFAEVSVTFDDSEAPRKLNCPYEEVTVTRRCYRAGESEYFINRKPCRLRDIYELFMNTGIGREGYSIVGQGKISEIISKKSEDRRGIFEESAGISKYRYQKHESEKKLAECEANMTRVSDIFTEIESRIGPLEKDAEKARKYLELYGEKKKLDVSLWLYDTEKLREDVDKMTSQCRLSAHELEMAEDDEKQLEAQYDRLFEASQENKQSSGALYGRIKEMNAAVRNAENEASRLENETVHAKAMTEAEQRAADKSREDAAEERKRAEALRARAAEIASGIDEKNAYIALCEKERDGAKSDEAALGAELEESLAVMRERESELGELRVRSDVLKNSISDRSDRQANISAELEKYEKQLSDIERDCEECRKSVELYENALKKSDSETEKCDRQLISLSDSIEAVRLSLSESEAAAEALHSRISALERMQEHFDGYNNSVKFVMQQSREGKLSGVRGPVSRLIKVSDEYTVALETAFGASLQNIVVDDERDAKACIYALKNAGAGRATFYPLSGVRAQSRTREMEDAAGSRGFVGYADELLETDEKYRAVISSIIGRVSVFDNIDNASDVARRSGWKLRIVTLDGQQINPGGSFTGGSVRRDSGMLTRASHIEKLQKEKAEAEKKSNETRKQLEELRAKHTELTNYRRKEDEKAKLSEVMLRTERAQLDEYEANKGVCENLLEQLRADRDSLAEQSKRGGEDAAGLEKDIAALQAEISKIAEERSETDIRRGEAQERAADAESRMNEGRIALAALMRDAENAQAQAAEADERAEKFELEAAGHDAEVTKLRDSIADAARSIAEKKNEAAELRASLAEAEEQRLSLEEGGAEYDRKLNENRRKTKEVTDRKELVFRAHSANEAKLERLNSEVDKMTSRLWDEYELTHGTALALDYPAITADSRSGAARRLAELKSAVKALGSVNVGAIEEYTALKERYDYLKAQLDDLRASGEELRGIIADIEAEMKRMFIETFEKVNKCFGETFRELFGGGSAHLTLTDPENVLTSGVDINAAPPGKMIKNLNLLSGGEQAFVAIALIFALIKVNPSPFCIFDEIEAALDEVNVARVASYIKRFSKEMQIILITHRRGMMETADTLYGVTMPRHGVSKVFTLDVASVAENPSAANGLVEN